MKDFKRTAKLLCFLITALAVLFCTACGSDSGSDGNDEPVTYTVIFETNGGSTIEKLTIESGKKITIPEAPTKEGYTFAGWYLDSELTEVFSADSKITKTITLYAKWTKNQEQQEEPDPQETPEETKVFKVTFETDGGSAVESQSVNGNSSIKKPADPTKDGFVFAGWYNGDVQYNFETPVTADLTLTAKWIAEDAKTYTVTFESDGTSIIKQIVEENGKASLPSAPTKEGYTFKTWLNGTNEYDFATPVTADLTLTAKWEINKYTVSFMSDGIAYGTAQTVEYNGKATAPADPKKDGFIFSGWLNGTVEYNFDTPVTADLTLTAKWIAEEIKTYTVTFMVDGKAYGKALTVEENKKVTAPDSPSKEHYSFVAWLNGASEYDFETPVTADLTLTASWAIDKFTVKFETNGGSSVESKEIEYNGKVERPANPTKDGYTFKGWLNGSDEYNFATPVTAALTLTAKWEINSYTVSFKVDGVAYGTPQTVEYNGTATQPETPTDETKIFDDWYVGNTKFDFTTKITGNTEIIGKWKEVTASQCLITYKTAEGEIINQIIVAKDSILTEPENPTKAGHSFAGWSFVSGTSTEVWDFSTGVTESMILTQSWEANKIGITVTLEQLSASAELTVNYNETTNTFSADDGFDSYAWFVDTTKTEEDSNTFTVDTTNLSAGYHSVVLRVKNADDIRTAEATIRVIK